MAKTEKYITREEYRKAFGGDPNEAAFAMQNSAKFMKDQFEKRISKMEKLIADNINPDFRRLKEDIQELKEDFVKHISVQMPKDTPVVSCPSHASPGGLRDDLINMRNHFDCCCDITPNSVQKRTYGQIVRELTDLIDRYDEPNDALKRAAERYNAEHPVTVNSIIKDFEYLVEWMERWAKGVSKESDYGKGATDARRSDVQKINAILAKYKSVDDSPKYDPMEAERVYYQMYPHHRPKDRNETPLNVGDKVLCLSRACRELTIREFEPCGNIVLLAHPLSSWSMTVAPSEVVLWKRKGE